MSNARNLARLKPNASGQLASSNIDLTTLPAGSATGTIVPYGGDSAPTDWLLCFGQAVSRTTYAALFAVLGTTYGSGDGSTTFNLPDLRGRVPGGKDNMGGTAANRLTSAGAGVDGATLGASGGAQTHTLTSAQMPAHSHAGSTASAGAHQHGYTAPSGSFRVGSGDSETPDRTVLPGAATTDSNGAHTHTLSISNTGGDGAHNNTQPTIILNYIIKT